MKKDSKKFALIVSLSALVTGGVVICSQIAENALNVPAQNTENKIEFNKFDESSGGEEITSMTTTLKGNVKNFKHKGYSFSSTDSHWGVLAQNGYIKNVEPIRHLAKIVIDSDASEGVIIQIDYSKDGTNFSSKLTRKYTLTSGKNEIAFDGISDYFKLTVISEGSFDISSIQLYFSQGVECDDTAADEWNQTFGGVTPYGSGSYFVHGYYPQVCVGQETEMPGEAEEMPYLRQIVSD